MTPDQRRALAQLARAARCTPLDTPQAIASYVRGVLTRLIEPEVLLEVLSGAGISEATWRHAGPRFALRRVLPDVVAVAGCAAYLLA